MRPKGWDIAVSLLVDYFALRVCVSLFASFFNFLIDARRVVLKDVNSNPKLLNIKSNYRK